MFDLRRPSLLIVGAAAVFACSRPPSQSVEDGSSAQVAVPPAEPSRPATQPPGGAAPSTLPAQDISDVAERSVRSVVNISAERVVRAEENPLFNDPFFRDFFGRRYPQVPRERRARSLGSGVIVSKDGVILTNAHVVAHGKDIKVTLSDRRELSADVVGADPQSDLAVLKVRGREGELRPLPFGDSDKLRLGEVVLAIGNPFGLGHTVTMGIVSAVGRANVGLADYEDFIQTDAAINPGNSGGPLVNLRGELVGVNTAILSRSGGNIGVGFAIPSNMARNIEDSLLRTGKVSRGFLGVAIQDIDESLAEALDLPNSHGALIADVTAGAPADKAGLKRGDVILRLGDTDVTSAAQLRNLIALTPPGTSVRILVYRDGKETTLQAQLGEAPTVRTGAERAEPTGLLGGLSLEPLTPSLRQRLGVGDEVKQGLVVMGLARGTPAQRAGLRPGDIILEADRTEIDSAETLRKVAEGAGERLLLLVQRRSAKLYVVLRKLEE